MDDQKERRFKEILIENDARIKKICRYYGTNDEDKKDIYQEVLVNIWKSLDKFRGDSSVSTWIYRIAVNTSISCSALVGYFIWRKRQKPLRDQALAILKDMGE